ncbi:choice-of-anchor J domain-containing protein [Carboxylicivirga mesophila]|uniref:Choice-of-anchor J domain-containing protein n=1 Tax=Carboxylicivirga mesophila TaxID=1166478 RepID=A0ABS5K4F8_9BACT|nr:choice-of-anchor J domain-containing protein [Carboxylicivirga mesophila]MBS2209905.1 choice-of-anchor J domain-containing protein [Carboxylicivirga mesophila]
MKKFLLFLLISLIPLSGFSQASDLFFSEYIEGSSNNKYIEIFNGTGAPVNLSDYQVILFSNGSSTPGNTLDLENIDLADNAVYVIANASADIYNSANTTSTVTYFNGDDAIALKKVSTDSYVDIFGCIGEDPGSAWTDGAHSTANKTLVRKASVSGGVTTNPTSGFPTLVSEWNVYDQDEASYLGSHTFSTVVGTVELTSPAGGENYTAGQVVKFMWNSTNVSNVYFEVWTQESKWEQITDNIASPDGDNEYDFTIPANAFSWDGYKLRVVDADNSSVSDESTAFIIDGHDTELLWEDFSGSQFNSTFQYSVLGANKQWTAYSDYAQMNGYDNQNMEAEEDWLITNAINMDNTTEELFVFESSVNYDNVNSSLEVYYSTDYSGTGDPTGSTWNTLSATFATSTTFTHSGYIDVSAISGTVYFAFKYLSSADGADLWQIKNIEITGVDTPTSVDSQKASEVVISPNPFTNELYIKGTKELQNIILFNTAGQVVMNDQSGSKRVSTANLPKGMYIVQVKFMDGTSTTQKVIKK